MIQLSFGAFESDETEARDDLSAYDESAIEWYGFRVASITLRVNGSCFDLTPSEPLLAFAIGIWRVALRIREGETLSYEFRDEGRKLTFRRSGDAVEISANYAEGHEFVPLDAFRMATHDFASDAFGAARRFNPTVAQSEYFQDCLVELAQEPD